MKRLLKPIKAWLPNARVPNMLPMNISLTFTALGSILWSRMVITKKLFVWPIIGLPAWLTIKKFASKFRVCINLGLKVTRTTATTRRLSLALPSWLNCSLKRLPSGLKLSVFTATGPMLKKMPTISPERLSLASITTTMIQSIQLA